MHLYALILALAVVIPGSAYDTWRSFDVDPLVAESVVWPEVERYSRLQDALETAANYGTYITTGGGPDFSIGLFQMKPSFVEEMEKAWMRSGLAREYELWFDTADNATARRIRISRLQKEEWQVIYVGVFLRLLYASYGSYNKKGERTQEGIETLPLKEQVRLAATAYNRLYDFWYKDAKDYVLNKNKGKFHNPDCKSVTNQMKESNKAFITCSRQRLIPLGYEPCGNCHP